MQAKETTGHRRGKFFFTLETTVSVVLAVGILGSFVYGQDEFMTCSRPVKSSRAGRFQLDLPCRGMGDGGDTWCNLPGPDYPWGAVRRFVFENQGLMRRMYGEVRQLSVLRMEFSGEDNHIEDARNFDEIFKPVTATPAMLNLMSTSGNQEPGVSRSISSSAEFEDPEQLTTVEFKSVTTEETIAATSSETGAPGGEEIRQSNSTAAVVGPESDPGPSTGTGANGDELSTDEVPTTTEGMPTESNSSASSPPEADEDKNRIEGQVLFQDFERGNPPSSTTEEPKVREYKSPGVNACPIKEELAAPYWANSTRGEILALLNLYPFEQYIHWEKCTNEHRQMYCRDGCRCEQQYRLHRLLAFDPHNECRGIFSDWFRFPSCCVCKCYFDEFPPERVSFNRSPRIMIQTLDDNTFGDSDEPDVNGVDDSHFYYKVPGSFRQPRK